MKLICPCGTVLIEKYKPLLHPTYKMLRIFREHLALNEDNTVILTEISKCKDFEKSYKEFLSASNILKFIIIETFGDK